MVTSFRQLSWNLPEIRRKVLIVNAAILATILSFGLI